MPAGAGAAPVSWACPTTRSSRNCARCGPSALTTASSASSHSRVSWGSTSTCDAIGAPDLLGARPLWQARPRPRGRAPRRAPSPAGVSLPAPSVTTHGCGRRARRRRIRRSRRPVCVVMRSTPPTTLPLRLDASSLPSPVTTRSAAVELLAQPDRLGDDVEAGAQRRTERGEAAGETARGAGARQVAGTSSGFEPRRRCVSTATCSAWRPFLRTENPCGVDEAGIDVAGADDFERERPAERLDRAEPAVGARAAAERDDRARRAVRRPRRATARRRRACRRAAGRCARPARARWRAPSRSPRCRRPAVPSRRRRDRRAGR